MFHYSQKDPRWKDKKLGSCKDTIGQSGCKITALGMFLYKQPDEVNEEMTRDNIYVDGCLTDDAKIAKYYNMRFDGRTTVKPKHICIAETNDYKTRYGVPQHFFVFAPKGTLDEDRDMILDPLDEANEIAWKENPYHIVSYRLFHEKKPEDNLSPEFKQAWEKMQDLDVYSEFTKVGEEVTTEELAVFLNRLINKIL